jgi:hypothetical protein
MVSLHPNGITMIADFPYDYYSNGLGWRHVLNGKEYYIMRDKDDLQKHLLTHEPEQLVTTFVTDLSNLFNAELPDIKNGEWDVS